MYKPDKKVKKAEKIQEIDEEEEDVESTSDPVVGRYRWLSAQMARAAIPVRPHKEELRHHRFLLTSSSENLKQNKFSYEGQLYTNPTIPLRKIYEAEGIDFKPANIKGWDQLDALVKKKLTDAKPEWVPLNKVIPPSFRRNKKGEEEVVVAETKKRKSPATPSPKKSAKKVAVKAVKQAKKKVVQKEVEESEKESESEASEEGEQDDQDIQELEAYNPVDLNIGYRKLSVNKVLGYEEKYQNVMIPREAVYSALGLSLNRAAVRSVLSFDIEETLKIIPHVNAILKSRDLPEEIELPDIKNDDGNNETTDTNNEIPDANDGAPDANDGAPDANNETPDANDETPDANDETPDTNDETPDANDETPDTNDETPNANDETPETSDETPGTDEEETPVTINEEDLEHEETPNNEETPMEFA
jgi:hypothetical protein